MTILLTTANFPDIMLQSYKDNYWYILYFISFLVVGLYFLMNFLLANVFNKFKDRLERNAEEIMKKTELLLIELFDRFDYSSKGYLNWKESKEFFTILLKLNLRKKQHFEQLIELMEIMGIQD